MICLVCLAIGGVLVGFVAVLFVLVWLAGTRVLLIVLILMFLCGVMVYGLGDLRCAFLVCYCASPVAFVFALLIVIMVGCGIAGLAVGLLLVCVMLVGLCLRVGLVWL